MTIFISTQQPCKEQKCISGNFQLNQFEQPMPKLIQLLMLHQYAICVTLLTFYDRNNIHLPEQQEAGLQTVYVKLDKFLAMAPS